MDRFRSQEEEEKVIELWNAGLHVADITREVGRNDPDEVSVFLIDLARAGRINYRPGGVFGGR
jgi:hypothetical protein